MKKLLLGAYLTGTLLGLVLIIVPENADAASHTVTIRDNQYIPASITVNPGDTITWINQGAMPHTVTDNAGAFDSGTISPGQSYTIQVQIPAMRTYRCEFHPGMTGAINVVAASSANSGSVNTNVNTNTNTNTSSNASALAAQAEALLLQIAALQAQLSGSTSASTNSVAASSALCPSIGRVLRLGSSGDDVSRLQRFLAADPSIYPEGMITGYYGSLTEAAVKRWQTRYNIVSSGDADSTGFGVTGPRTAAAISLQCSTDGTFPGGSNITSPTVGGFIQVTPVAGNSPLTVQVTATVNTVNSCQAATYTLDWGDGTIAQSIHVPAGRCGQLQQIYSHIYLYGGTYLLRLSAGEHSTNATVQVFGANAPNPISTPGPINTTPSVSFSAPGSGQTASLGGNLGITWTSQNAPSGSKVRLEVYKSSDNVATSNNDRGLTSNSSELPTSGSFTWTLPSSSGAVLADAGHSGFALTPGTYKIAAKLYSGSTCWGFCAGTQNRTVHASAQSSTFTIAGASFSFGPLAVNPGVSGDPLGVAATFNIPASCAPYSLNWGDGTISSQGSSSGCTGSPVTRTFTHEYASGGTYTITLRRDTALSQVDTASITIAN